MQKKTIGFIGLIVRTSAKTGEISGLSEHTNDLWVLVEAYFMSVSILKL